ncbi:MAG: LysR family transcriptional regulator [Spirochaetia bacterium]|uniref:LysR family transcriptional regulator n=1 Tax=Treponema sp. TaxID=166 RepID=UPI00298DF6B1|nr:LysR family transcriptional regulator [Treponema sp.]MCI7397948.1 LysR family transcriptional regulator [Spirochaetia bacterium]MCI7578046.1 LysR family transcriptional regulator [Spirochaetia bacterium]
MTIQQLKYIIGVSETGSINKAAEILYVSQPSLTAAIKDVENEFNITIFNRSSKGITLTSEGKEFIQYGRQIYAQYDNLLERFGDAGKSKRKKHFAVSTQHYSFAVKSFVEMVKKFDTTEYEFAINETRTLAIIEDVSTGRSEIGILFLSDFNRKAMTKLFNSNDLVFEKLITCDAYVYLWKKHPLAKEKSISFEQLKDYPCLSFDQNASSAFYYAEEILTENEYPKMIKTTDRATNLNLMVGLNAYTLCSGIICQELNGGDFVAVPFESDRENKNSKMEIGYVIKKNIILSQTGEDYLNELKKYLAKCRQ